MSSKSFLALFVLAVLHLVAANAAGQFTNRYPKVAGFGHHIYLEGYNLPTLNAGLSDPAVAPDGRTLVAAARGWLWQIDLTTREARRLTRGPGLDSRPAWSPDGKRVAFVRDTGKDTGIVVLDVAAGTEKVLVDTPALDLDPAFSRDGRAVLYSSAESGDLDLWRIDVATGAKTRLTTDKGLELQPQPLPGDTRILFVAKPPGSGIDNISLLDTRDGTRRILREESIASQLRPALSPDGRSVAANVPAFDGSWQLWLIDLRGGTLIRLAHRSRLPLSPAWSPDGASVFFVEADAAKRFQLRRVAATGGEPEEIKPVSWNWGDTTPAQITIKTRRAGEASELPTRLSIVDGDGHPAIPETGQPRFEMQNGVVFVYSTGTLTMPVPAGEVRITAAHGLNTVAVTRTQTVRAGEQATIELELPAPVWNPAAEGWYGGDLHSHLNYGGPYSLVPEDLLLDIRAEALDVSTPQLANLHTRFSDIEWWGWRRTSGERPLVVFSQEVRSHFLGHVAVLGADALFWPWYSGPGYPVYNDLDLPNTDALRFAREHGGVNSYVHPVSGRNPFPADAPPAGLPLELVPDALHGDVDTLEIVCLWSDELGTSEAWYRLLNLGLPVMPSAGSDTMHNLFRTMAIGSTRVYVKPEGALTIESYLDALRRGRSFVTNGPMLKLGVEGAEAGGVVRVAPGGEAEWTLDAWSALPVEKVEIIVNGRVAWSGDALPAAGHKKFSGRIEVPRGGWVAARVYGGTTRWPSMDSYPFAHTAPVWFGERGSTDPDTARRAARDLLRWMDVADRRLADGYAGASAARLRKRFADARKMLVARAGQTAASAQVKK